MIYKTSYLNKFIVIFIFIFSLNIMSESISLDGVISPDEWNDASIFNLEYEVMPSRNTEAALETKAYVKFDKNDETLLDKQTNVTNGNTYHTMYQCRKL